MNKKTHKYLQISLLLFPLLFLGVSFSTSAMGANTPATSEVEELKGVNTLGGYTSKVFDTAMGVAGGLAAIAFAIGAVQYMVSAGNPTSAKEGKNKMISALLGVTLTLGSLILLKSIYGPGFTVGIKQPQYSENYTGVYLFAPAFTGRQEFKLAYSDSVPSLVPEWALITNLRYSCPEGEAPESLPFYLFIGYSEKNYAGTGTKKILACGGDIPLPLGTYKSYQLILINPGVYLFSDDDCINIIKAEPQISSINDARPAKSFFLVSSAFSYYMVSFHENINYEGNCTAFYGEDITAHGTMPKCEKMLSLNNSMTIVHLDTSPLSTGEGIRFFQSTNYGGGTTKIDKSKIENATKIFRSYKILDPAANTNETTFNYSGSTVLPEVKNICTNLSSLGQQNCPGSIKVDGRYIVKLKAKNTTESYCRVFSQDDPNLRLDSETLFGDGSRKLTEIEILQGTR